MAKKANKGSFKPGDTRAGRPKGCENKATAEVRQWAQGIFKDDKVKKKTLELAQAGKLAPAIYNELLHYAYGKPKDTIEIEGQMTIARVARVIVDGSDASD